MHVYLEGRSIIEANEYVTYIIIFGQKRTDNSCLQQNCSKKDDSSTVDIAFLALSVASLSCYERFLYRT